MKKVLLIDGDQFLFTACVAVEQEIRWDDQNHVLWSNAVEARRNLDGMLGRIFDRFETKDHVLCFTAGVNFRLGIDSTYKNHRVGQRKPMCYAALRGDVETSYKCLAMDTLEADDVMGILATKPTPGKSRTIIVSQDKDMRTIPGTLWNGKDLLSISEAEADYNHLYQTLVGDTADGFPGCPGVGPVKAEKLLQASYVNTQECRASGSEDTRCSCVDCGGPVIRAWDNDYAWDAVVEAYDAKGLTEDDALRQARLARILRWSDWDGENKKPILWTP